MCLRGAVGRTERLWLSEPRRKTALVEVTAAQRDVFQVDRSLFCPKSRTYRHPQPSDQGVVWTPDGEKRKLVTVFEDDRGLWHRLRGATPSVGDRLQCHLDPDRRETIARGHTAMHLLIHTLPRAAGRFAEDPEVRGGGHVRFTFDVPWIPPPDLSSWRSAALALIQQDRPLQRIHVVDTEVPHKLRAQPFAEAPYPGPVTTREAVAIEGVGALPCDGTHLERTGGIGGLVVPEAHPDRQGRMVVVFRALPP